MWRLFFRNDLNIFPTSEGILRLRCSRPFVASQQRPTPPSSSLPPPPAPRRAAASSFPSQVVVASFLPRAVLFPLEVKRDFPPPGGRICSDSIASGKKQREEWLGRAGRREGCCGRCGGGGVSLDKMHRGRRVRARGSPPQPPAPRCLGMDPSHVLLPHPPPPRVRPRLRRTRGSGGRPGSRGWGKISVSVSKFESLQVGDGPEVGGREAGDGGACKVLQCVRTLL
jgi:hypothetical protein